MKKVLLIDRSIEYVKKVKRALEKENQIFTADRSHRALLRICQANPDVIVLSTSMGDYNPLSFLKQLNSISPESSIIVTDNDYQTKRGRLYKKEGAYDYIRKSEHLENLILTVNEALSISKPEYLEGRKKILNEILGNSSEASLLKMKILKFSQYNFPVLLLGESGTGKDLAAYCMHRLSIRHDHRYININCGAIPDNLVESELFGVEKGAFTDSRTIPGKFEQASGGTIFLNEIGELPQASQVKLLKILESKTVIRLGGTAEKHINVRVITATNTDLKKAVKEKTFRKDLLYRINTLYMEIPPLRKRKEDIQIIAEKILEDENDPKQLSLNALEKLSEHNWPGNIRELINVMNRARAYSLDEIIRSSDIQFF